MGQEVLKIRKSNKGEKRNFIYVECRRKHVEVQEESTIPKWAWVGKAGCTVSRWINERHVSNPFPLTLSILMHKTHLSLSSLRFALTNLHRSVISIFSKLLFSPVPPITICETLHPNLLSHLFFFLFIMNDKYCLTISASYGMPHGSLF